MDALKIHKFYIVDYSRFMAILIFILGVYLLIFIKPLEGSLIFLKGVSGLLILISWVIFAYSIGEIRMEPTCLTIRRWRKEVKIPAEAILKIKVFGEKVYLNLAIKPQQKVHLPWFIRYFHVPYYAYEADIKPFIQDLITFYGDKVVCVNWGSKRIF